MNILVLGTGLQGKAALYDLANSPDVSRVVAADADIDSLKAYVAGLPTNKITSVQIDVMDTYRVSELMQAAQAVIMLLPPEFGPTLAPLAIANNAHWIDASYTFPEYRELHEEAKAKDLAILPEFGLDPGIDLLLAALALDELDEVHEFYSYGSGIPERPAADNPLKYRISWSFDIVLYSYTRPARLITRGNIVEIPPTDIFDPNNVHIVEIDELGTLEAYPNGDAVNYAKKLGLDNLRSAGRYTMRWPGHSAFWSKAVKIGLLNDDPVYVGQVKVSPRQFLSTLLTPQLQYEEHQRDVAVVRIDVRGLKGGQYRKLLYQMTDFRDLETGLLAMQRTVGFTASIGAQLILRGDIGQRGLLSPLTDVPPGPVLDELAKRGIKYNREEYEAPV